MKSIKHIISGILIYLIAQNTCLAQGWKKLPVVISGKITSELKPGEDSIRIAITNDYQLIGFKKLFIPINKNGEFYYMMDSISRPAKIGLSIGIRPLFIEYIEPGDSLQFSINASPIQPLVTFDGNNILKYKCMDSIQNLTKTINESVYLKEGRTSGDYQKLNSMYMDTYLNVLKVFETYKGKINPSMAKFLLAGCTMNTIGIYYDLITHEFRNSKDEKVRKQIIKSYALYHLPDYNLDQDIASLHEFYMIFILIKCKAELLFKSNGTGYTYNSLYNYLKNNYRDNMRERLLTYFLIDYRSSNDVVNFQPEDFGICMRDALSLIKNPYLIQLLRERSNSIKGTQAFDFSMTDTVGNLVKLSDFKRKVILLDVWGVGCSGCAYFHKNCVTKMAQTFKGNVNFEIISINLDGSKERWFTGINSGLYTTKEQVNLFANGLGMSHPFVKHYKFNALPFIMLVGKNGKIYSKIDVTLSSNELEKLIYSALAEK